jgi:hypothetical protein
VVSERYDEQGVTVLFRSDREVVEAFRARLEKSERQNA